LLLPEPRHLPPSLLLSPLPYEILDLAATDGILVLVQGLSSASATLSPEFLVLLGDLPRLASG
jgi:hypothetical protein